MPNPPLFFLQGEGKEMGEVLDNPILIFKTTA